MLCERVDSTRLNELARRGAGLAFRLSVADLARLSVCLCHTDRDSTGPGTVELAADVHFDCGPEGFPRVGLSVVGQLSLQCQRCLEPVAWPVCIETCLSVLDSEEQTELIASPLDSILIGADGLDLAVVIEDEIMAALPMAPVHRDEPKCRQASGDDKNSAIETESTHRPFADLASLAGRRGRDAGD